MNTFSVDMGTNQVSIHTTESAVETMERIGTVVSVANYRHLAREFKRGRRFVRWENGYAEIVRAPR